MEQQEYKGLIIKVYAPRGGDMFSGSDYKFRIFGRKGNLWIEDHRRGQGGKDIFEHARAMIDLYGRK